MDIIKPRQERDAQQKNKNRKSGSRGAVIQRTKQSKGVKSLSVKKQLADIFTQLSSMHILKHSWFFVAVLMLSVMSVSFYAVRSLKADMPIERVTVKGDFYQIDKRELELTLEPLVGSNYLDVNINNIKTSLMNFSWVQSVEVRKIWPASLEVSVVENQAIATWGGDGFVNELGKVFKPQTVNKEFLVGLPDLNGLDKQSDLVLNTYVQFSELSRRSNLKITQFSLVANNYWELHFDQGSKVLLARGRELQSLNTFLDVYQQSLKDANQQLVKVDMRYNNGFSVEYGEPVVMKVSLEETERKDDLSHKKQDHIKTIETVRKNHG